MALFQPTNIIPSTLIGQGTVDVNDNMEISWQVNGNSAMTAFQIDFYMNDTASTYVTTTGKLPASGETQAQYGLPFYGTDRFGNPQFFTWNAQKSWAQWSMLQPTPFTNGNEYKFKITQFYNGGDRYTVTTNTAFSQNMQYYFSLVNKAGKTVYVQFIFGGGLPGSKTIVYNIKTGVAYIVGYEGAPLTVTETSDTPTGTNIGVASNEVRVDQVSASSFITRDKPTLTINQTDENYLNPIALHSTLATSIIYFQADYTQEQGDAIRWIRWQVAQSNNGVVGEILADTGDIYTPTLNFEFNGFFNGQQYAIRCFGESESGQSTQLTNLNQGGWVFFSINIVDPGQYNGNFTAKCLHKENTTLLKWESLAVIPAAVSPDGLTPTTYNSSVMLNPNSSITWDKVGGDSGQENMNFPIFWTAVWKGQLKYKTTNYSTQIVGIPENAEMFEGKQYWVYSQTFTIPKTIIVKVNVVTSPDVAKYTTAISRDEQGSISITVKLYSMRQEYRVGAVVNVMHGTVISPQNKFFSVLSADSEILSLSNDTDMSLALNLGNTNIEITVLDFAVSCAMIISPANIITYFYNSNGIVGMTSQPILIENWQQPITSVSIYGGDSGATVDSVSVYQGDGSNILSLYQSNPNFEPVWNAENYSLYMTANFNGNLEGGTGTASGKGFQIYRQEVGKTTLIPVANVPSTVTSLKDYGIVSRKAYQYFLYVYDNTGAFMSAVEAENAIATNFKNYSLLVCEYDQEKDAYHVRKQYLFALNLTDGSVGNNNSPTLNANFTQYPTRMPSTQNYASGTLSGLIGAIYTVPALVEQIGQYKYTAKPSTMDYFDSVDLEKELYDLSVVPYQLFLRDMKGRLRMIATSAPITMTTNLKQRQQSITISLPWVEVGDVSNVTIIQTPDDYGWNNDNQVLDVQLDVDVATGELSAQYPFPYNGTKFYLTGVNKETLTAKTPLGITPAQFELSDTAEQPDDGELSATVTINSEDNK